ncbi:metallophosphoesterase [Sediminibacillus massiliensis]|uniref:metallophosphoesterase n=1 Tax=Sediminibacillus massiliensis TaxID=1926277 RepID=UPI00098877D5|nr:metallophosphoesterase [Sediminibacillus massiliensis]
MKKKLLWLSIILVIAALSSKVYLDTNDFKVKTVEFKSTKLPKNAEITVLQISDLHNKVFDADNETLLDTVKRLNADIIVLTGDLIDRDTESFQHVFEFVEKLTVINDKVFFVSGNHEWGNTGTEEFIKGLQERNITLLNNKNTEVSVGKVTLNLAGVDDVSTSHENIEEAFKNINKERYTILLSHSPGVVDKYENVPADLTLSGHTHGGQVRLPFIGALVAPDQGLFPKLDQGTFEMEQNQYLYIDSGLGTSVAPVRFLNKSQMSMIKIVNSN